MTRFFVLCGLVLPLLAVAGPDPSPAPPPPAPPPTRPAPHAPPGPPPAPPSTGKELRKPPPGLPPQPATMAAVARELVKKNDCKGHVHELSGALSYAAYLLKPDEEVAGYQLLQRCAYSEKAWRAVLQATSRLLTLAPDKSRPYDVVEALLGMDMQDQAQAAFDRLEKEFPKQHDDLTLARTLLACHGRTYSKCHAVAGDMLKELKKSATPSPDALLKNTIFHGVSAAALGKWAEYDADMRTADKMIAAEKKDPSKLAALKAALEPTRGSKLYIEADVVKQLPIGTYQYMANPALKEAGDLVTLRLINHQPKARTVKITLEVPGVTETTTVSVSLPPGEQLTRALTPPLKMDFDVAKLRASRVGQIALKITDDKGASVYEQSYPLEVLPRDHLPLWRYIGADSDRQTFANALAWITPNAPEVDAFLAKAKARLDKHVFAGEQRETLSQVKALFDELKERGVSYVMDPAVFAERVAVQRTRLPVEVLASTNAQCLEGTLLYATLMEAIGLQPELVFIPGHAFVAWKPSQYDKDKAPLYFLETTLTGGPATFEQAVERATKHYQDEKAARHFDIGVSALVDVHALRAKGYTPQPY